MPDVQTRRRSLRGLSAAEVPEREQVAGCEPAAAHALHPLWLRLQPFSPHVQRVPGSLGTRLRPRAQPHFLCQELLSVGQGALGSSLGSGGESSKEGDESVWEIVSPRVMLAPGTPPRLPLPSLLAGPGLLPAPDPGGPGSASAHQASQTQLPAGAQLRRRAGPTRAALESSRGLGRAGGRAGATLWSRRPASALTAIEGVTPRRQRNQGVISGRKAGAWSTPPKRSVPVGFVARVASLVALEFRGGRGSRAWEGGKEEGTKVSVLSEKARRGPARCLGSAHACRGCRCVCTCARSPLLVAASLAHVRCSQVQPQRGFPK